MELYITYEPCQLACGQALAAEQLGTRPPLLTSMTYVQVRERQMRHWCLRCRPLWPPGRRAEGDLLRPCKQLWHYNMARSVQQWNCAALKSMPLEHAIFSVSASEDRERISNPKRTFKDEDTAAAAAARNETADGAFTAPRTNE